MVKRKNAYFVSLKNLHASVTYLKMQQTLFHILHTGYLSLLRLFTHTKSLTETGDIVGY